MHDYQDKDLQADAVLREFRRALDLGAHGLAERIEQANPELAKRFALLRFTVLAESKAPHATTI